jgi:hypothetical protein
MARSWFALQTECSTREALNLFDRDFTNPDKHIIARAIRTNPEKSFSETTK